MCGNITKKFKLSSIVSKRAGLNKVFKINVGCIPSAKRTISSLSLESLKIVNAAATKK